MVDPHPVPLDALPDFLTVEEAAAVLRIGRSAAYDLTALWRATGGREGLPVVQRGRRLRVPKAGLQRLLAIASGHEQERGAA